MSSMSIVTIRRKFTSIALLAALGCTCLGVSEVRSSEPDPGWTINLVEENDSFNPPSDRHYTQGLMLSASSGERCGSCRSYEILQGVSDLIFPDTTGTEQFRYGVFLGQSIFTPQNLTRVRPDPRDRPYAGWLYGGTNMYRDAGKTLDKAQVTIGLVGPDAKGGEAQNWWHEYTYGTLGASRVEGWNAQLRNEPGIVLSQNRIWRHVISAGEFDVDLLPQVNASLGNVLTYAGAGGLIRFGERLDVDWGPPRIEPALSGSDFINRGNLDGRWFAWYLFAGSEARIVARNIFLDGNTFTDSASVDKENLVADFVGGVSMTTQIGRLTGSYTLRTKEFSNQERNDEFISITLSVRF